MKTYIISAILVATAVPAAADESLLEMLRRPTSPALAAVLGDEAPALSALDTQAAPAAAVRVTREIVAEPVTVSTITVTPGRGSEFTAYVKRD